MPRKTTILIVVLAAITGLLIFLAVRNESGPSKIAQTTPEPTAVAPYAKLGFKNPTIDVSTGSANQTEDIVIDTAQKPSAGAQIELSYNPAVITNVKFVPTANPFFGKDAVTLISSVDPTQGRASYAVGLGQNGSEKSGTGTVVTLSFTVNKTAGLSSTQISFLDKSAVSSMKSQNSVLLNTTPLQVIISPASK